MPLQNSELTADSYTSYYAQTYWNQKAFIDSIADQLRNGNDTQDVAANFALNPNSMSSINGRLNSLRQIMDAPAHGLGYANGAGNTNSSGIWASVSGNSLSTDRDDYIGSPNWHSSSLAYTVGYTGGNDSFDWGVAVGHQKSDLTFYDRAASGTSEGYNAGLYAGWQGKGGYLNAILGYGNYDNDASTHDGSGSANFKTHGLSAALEIGKHLSGDKDNGFTPYAALMWVRSKVGNIDESYERGTGVTFRSGSQNTLTAQLGVRYLHTMIDKNGQKKGGWRAGLSWLHNFGNNDFAMEASYPILDLPYTFTERNTPLFNNALQVELGAYGRIHNSLVGFVGYRGVFSSDQKQNSVSAGIGYQF
jgi:outer membrane autotransporter protein